MDIYIKTGNSQLCKLNCQTKSRLIHLIINAESIRLIANMIIYHNAKILSALYEYYTAKDPGKSLEIIHWSPVAWRFVNLIGNYEFYRKDKIINVHEVIEKLIASFEIDFLSESLE
ncbi:Tn3 family transposase [Providencia rettgeri]|uniref:Tn3 family transposase n=1 Tax=Providencia rettgeri TaxID=587 RepID=UPI003AFA1AD9